MSHGTPPSPTLADRVVGWLSPQAGYRRVAWRAALAQSSGHVAARRDRRATMAWDTMSASADAATLPGLDVIRARAQDLVRNDPLAQSAISTKCTNVIGTGHMLRPEPDRAALGLSDDRAAAWEARALAIWDDWARSPDADFVRVQPFAEMEDLVYRSALVDGDCLVLRRYRTRRGRMLGTCLQVVPAGRVSNPGWQADGDRLAGGVEFDADGAALAYHVADRFVRDRTLSGGSPTWRRVPAYDRFGRRQVWHIHGARWRPDMTRYAPMLAPVIEALKQRSRYTEAELMAAVVSACFAIAMKSPGGDLASPLQNDTDAPSASEINLTEPGTIVDLGMDEEIQAFSPGRPNPQYLPFVDAIAQEIGAGTDLPYELLLKRFQASYSASRAALEMAWQFFRVERARHVQQFCRPVYREVIAEAVARGLIEAPGFFTDPLAQSAWLRSAWIGPARITLDPVKDANADAAYLGMGVTTRTQIAAERFARDYDDVRRRAAAEGAPITGDDDT